MLRNDFGRKIMNLEKKLIFTIGCRESRRTKKYELGKKAIIVISCRGRSRRLSMNHERKILGENNYREISKRKK